MTWDEICEDPNLRDLPFKIETNRRGQIIMSPARSRHGEYQVQISILLSQLLPHGRAVVECAVPTNPGVRLPQLVWAHPQPPNPVI